MVERTEGKKRRPGVTEIDIHTKCTLQRDSTYVGFGYVPSMRTERYVAQSMQIPDHRTHMCFLKNSIPDFVPLRLGEPPDSWKGRFSVER